MKRLLIDLTDIEKWNGLHGGTQRVVYGITKNFYLQKASLDYELSFISYSSHSHAYIMADFVPIYERVETLKQASAAPGSSRLPLRARLKHQIIHHAPERVRTSPAARSIAKKSLRLALKSARKASSLVSKAPRIKLSNGRTVKAEFNKDDTVLILGKPWDDLNIQKILIREKERTGFKLAQVVYDLIIPLQPQLHHPSLFASYTENMFEAASVSDVLLAISHSSANDLKKFCRQLNLPEPNVKVIRLGDDITAGSPSKISASPDSRIKREFIACVGTFEIRKNHALLYYAYKLAAQKGIDLPQLVIVGSHGWLSNDIKYLIEHDPMIKGKILLLLGSVTDSGLDWVYRNCLFTVYPSMYEGWGLPVAESLGYGKPCVAAGVSSIPEIAGDLIDYFSPYSSEELLIVLQKYLKSTELRQKEQAIAANYRPVSWEHTYQQTKRYIEALSKAEG